MKEKGKIRLYRFLGAEQFQKIVFLLERAKYWVIEKYFPNITEWYEKQCDQQYVKRLEKSKIADNKNLLNEFQKQKLAFRKEIVYKQNRNYHYDPNYPTQFVKYLEMNKKIHQRGLIKDIIFLVGIAGITFLLGNPSPIISITLIILQCISMMINFECINLQNYNLCRFQEDRMQKLLEKTEEKKLNKNLKKLSEGMKPVSEAVNKQMEIPTLDQVVEQITTRTQAKQLLEYAKEQLLYLEETKLNEKNKQMRRK